MVADTFGIKEQQLKQFIKEELAQVLLENEDEEDLSSQILTLLQNPDEGMHFSAVNMAPYATPKEYNKAKQYTISYIKSIIKEQPYDLRGNLREEWKANKEFFLKFQELQKTTDPYELVEGYRELLDGGTKLEIPIKLYRHMLPIFVYHDPDSSTAKSDKGGFGIRDDEGDLVDVSSDKFVNIHMAHYIREFLLGSSPRDPSTYKY